MRLNSSGTRWTYASLESEIELYWNVLSRQNSLKARNITHHCTHRVQTDNVRCLSLVILWSLPFSPGPYPESSIFILLTSLYNAVWITCNILFRGCICSILQETISVGCVLPTCDYRISFSGHQRSLEGGGSTVRSNEEARTGLQWWSPDVTKRGSRVLYLLGTGAGAMEGSPCLMSGRRLVQWGPIHYG